MEAPARRWHAKAWISVKNTEKLKTAIKQTEEKKMFLKELFGFEL